MADKKESPPFVISHESNARNAWDGAMFFVVVFLCIVVPLRIGFNLMEWKAWIGPDIVVDLLLLVDIFVSAFTTFEQDGELVRDRKQILMKYFWGWMVLDMLSVIPLDYVALLASDYHPGFRANRLIRITRLVYFFISWEKVSSLKPSVIRIFKSTFVILYLAHFIGCVFFLVILIEGDQATKTFTGSIDIRNKTLGSQYLRSFYWSFVTMTGYNNTNPNTQLETIFCIFVTMIGISLFATIIGTVGSLVTNLDSSKLYFRQKMDGINDYMKYKRIPVDLQNEVRSYYSYLWKSGKGLDKNKVLDDLPPYLKNKMNVYLNSEIIKKVSLFETCKDDQEFITEVVKCLKSRVCLPNSFVVRKGEMGTEMYFISRGELNVVNDADVVVFTLRDGGFFGEIALLYDTKRTASIVARTYCDMFILTKEDFKKVMKKFPQQSKGIKEIAKLRFQSVVDADKEEEEKKSSTQDNKEIEDNKEQGVQPEEEEDLQQQPEEGSQGAAGQDEEEAEQEAGGTVPNGNATSEDGGAAGQAEAGDKKSVGLSGSQDTTDDKAEGNGKKDDEKGERSGTPP